MHAYVVKDLISVFKSLTVTNVLPSFCDVIPLYDFKLVPFRKIMDTLLNILFWLANLIFLLFLSQNITKTGDLCTIFCLILILHVAGVITDVEGERKYVKDGKLIDMLVIHIENDGLKLNVVVLGEMVIGSRILWQQNIMYGTRLLINPDISEAVMLQKSVYCRETSQYLSVLFGKPAYVAENKVLYSTERKIIKELRAAADVEFYIVLAIVLDVEPVPSWWYKFCVCSVKVEANVDTYFYCNKDVNNVVDRYKLDLLVFDGTVTTTFVVFIKEVATLFERTYTEMVKKLMYKKGETNKDPTGFKEFFLDKEFPFKVEVDTTRWWDSYDVSVISFDPTILARWRDTQGSVKSSVPPAGPVTYFDGDDFLILKRKRSIEQLKLSEEGGIYCVLATGLEVIDHSNWWISACKCGKTIMKGGMIDQPLDFAQLLGKGIIFKVKSISRNNLNLEVNFKVTDFCSYKWNVNEFKSLQLPVNPVWLRSEYGCFVCEKSPDLIVINWSVTKIPIVKSLLDEFNMSSALSIKKKC
ncbi:hypothetical protein Ahy_B10g104427 [Arachis hypogaea]|uniref:DUF223 domain-containing protein n=1 Tax=Arachis hypogaea TaxID=3818 RepID=A0A444X5G4_ARAHY|nr:hypothetical protein Ahy_B10g104427 [Arachis hypogaea]